MPSFSAEPFRVELTGPDGRTWRWGRENAAQRVWGTALGFCLSSTIGLGLGASPPSANGALVHGPR
ncbi:hypothetical protein [Amycolatopsis sp. CA-230715]|uniref:hypothetical protein n=1 Tax=Amycolatopsis sp. CA-230715 TaxID=2745196 RepID=UPI003FA41860